MVMHKLGSIGRVSPSAAHSKTAHVDMATPPMDAFDNRSHFETGEPTHISMDAQPWSVRHESEMVIRMASSESIEDDHVECGSDLFLG